MAVEPVQTAIALAALLGFATLVLGIRRIPQPFMPAWSILRAAVQLAALSLILSGIISELRWVAVALVVMFSAAVWTVSTRIGHTRRDVVVIAASLSLGAIVPLVTVFAAHAVEFSGRYLLAVGGIVIGGVMSRITFYLKKDRVQAFDMQAAGMMSGMLLALSLLALGFTMRLGQRALR